MDPVVNRTTHSRISKLIVTLLLILSSLQITDHSLPVGLNKNVMFEGGQGSSWSNKVSPASRPMRKWSLDVSLNNDYIPCGKIVRVVIGLLDLDYLALSKLEDSLVSQLLRK